MNPSFYLTFCLNKGLEKEDTLQKVSWKNKDSRILKSMKINLHVGTTKKKATGAKKEK